MNAATEADLFLIEQLIRPIVNLYRISTGGQPVAFVRQKRMAFKEDIRFFADENESNELFRIKARRAIDIGGRYDVVDQAGERIGLLEHAFKRSLFRSTWQLLGPGEEHLATAEERSLALAIVRRLVDLPLPYHFTIKSDDRQIGEVRRKFALRDTYEIDLQADAERRIDRRLAMALGIALDALQAR